MANFPNNEFKICFTLFKSNTIINLLCLFRIQLEAFQDNFWLNAWFLQSDALEKNFSPLLYNEKCGMPSLIFIVLSKLQKI